MARSDWSTQKARTLLKSSSHSLDLVRKRKKAKINMSSEFGTPETTGYVGMAERLRRMQNRTPDRFRRDPGKKPAWEPKKRATVVSSLFKKF